MKSNSGRYTEIDLRTGKKIVVEPIMPKHKVKWGDINPSTKKVEGSYGNKHEGAIDESESIITKENGFTNITYTSPGESPTGVRNDKLNK